MQIPILIEEVPGNGYRSRGGEPFALCAEGATREEVLAKLQEQLQARMQAGHAIVPLEIPLHRTLSSSLPECLKTIRCITNGRLRWLNTASTSRKIRTFHEPFRTRSGHVDSLVRADR